MAQLKAVAVRATDSASQAAGRVRPRRALFVVSTDKQGALNRMQTRLADHHLLGGTSSSSSSLLGGPLRPASARRVTSINKKSTGRSSGPLPLPRFGSQTLPETSSRDVSCDAHCAIPWEIAEKSLVDPAGKDACGVSVTAHVLTEHVGGGADGGRGGRPASRALRESSEAALHHMTCYDQHL